MPTMTHACDVVTKDFCYLLILVTVKMCSLPVRSCFAPAFDAKRISKSKLHKYLIRDRPDEKILKEMSKVCIYQQTVTGMSPLFLAISRDKKNIVEKLLDIYESDFKVLKANGHTKDTGVLIAFGDDEIKFVERKLAKISAAGEGDDGLLILMKETNESPARVVKLAAKTDDDKKIFLGIVERLYVNGTFDVDSKTYNGDTLFLAAASQGSIHVLEKLLEFEVRHDEPSNFGISPFELACKSGQLDAVKWFHKKYKIDLLKFVMEGQALFSIAGNGSFDIFDYILTEIKRHDGEEHFEEIFNRKTEYQNNNVLMEALNRSQPEFVKKCFKYKTFLNVIDGSNSNLLHYALRSYPPDLELVKLLIETQPTLLIMEDSEQWTPLHLLATNLYLEELKNVYKEHPTFKSSFFKHFADSPTLEKKKEKIWCSTPGHAAFTTIIYKDGVDMAEFILENHADEFDSAEFISGLLVALTQTLGPMKIVELLQKLKRFDVSVPDKDGSYALFTALQSKRFDLFNYLLKLVDNKDLNKVTDNMNHCILEYAIWRNPVDVNFTPYAICSLPRDVDSSDYDAEEEDKPSVCDDGTAAGQPDQYEINRRNERITLWDIFQDLIARGVDFKHKDSSSSTLLHVAVENDNVEVVRELVKLGLEVGAEDSAGNTPIHRVKSLEVFQALSGEKLTAEIVCKKNKHGQTAFMNLASLFAFNKCPEELFNEFMNYGVDVNAPDNQGNRIIQAVNTEDWAKMLIKHGADPLVVNASGENLVHLALRNQKWDLARWLLLNTDIDRFAVTNDEVSYLGYFSSSTNFNEVFKGDLAPVLDQLMDKFINGKTLYCGPVTHMLVQDSKFKYLQHPSADLHRKEEDGQNCLHKAIGFRMNNLDLVKFLIEKGLDINSTTEHGMTPLMMCLDFNCAEFAHYLIKQDNIDLNLVNVYGFTALHYAARNEHIKSVCMILAAGGDGSILNNENKTYYDLLTEFHKKVFRSFLKQQ